MKERDEWTSLAEAIRAACLEAAIRSYHEAGVSGLCHEGRWECAVAAIRDLDLEALGREIGSAGDSDL